MAATFWFNEDKALSALAFIASERPGFSAFFVSKIMFYAEKAHINAYGRPVLGDNYVKMQDGPVPSKIKNYVDEKWHKVKKPAHFEDFVTINHGEWVSWLYRGKQVSDFALLSDSDKDCLREAIAFCEPKSKEELSDLTHLEKSWLNARPNRWMDYRDFVDDDNPHKADILAMMQEQSNYGVL